MATDDLAALSTASIRVFSSDALAVLDSMQLNALTTAQFAALTSSQVEALTTTQVQTMASDDLAALTTTNIRHLMSDDIGVLDSAQFNALTTAHYAAFTTDQVAGISSTQADTMTTANLAAISWQNIGALGTAAIDILDTAQIRALSAADIKALTTDQFVHIRTEEFAALTTAQVAAFTTAEAAAMTTDQIVAFTTSQIAGISTQVIAAMSMDQISAFEDADQQKFSNAQMNAALANTPIVLDLDGNGIQTVSATHGVVFDVAATGTAHKTGWVGGNDALLVMDRNGDGKINNGSELFGAGTQLVSGGHAANGFQALADQDTNHDGKITAVDANFNQIKLWVDANHDGKTDAGELHGLADFGITSLNLDYTHGTVKDNGNLLGLVSSYSKADGSTHAMTDVWLAKDKASTEPPPKLHELLSAPQGELLGGAGAATAPTTTATTTVTAGHEPNATLIGHAGFHLRGLLDDENRQAPLI
jgi:hypothetical protein